MFLDVITNIKDIAIAVLVVIIAIILVVWIIRTMIANKEYNDESRQHAAWVAEEESRRIYTKTYYEIHTSKDLYVDGNRYYVEYTDLDGIRHTARVTKEQYKEIAPRVKVKEIK